MRFMRSSTLRSSVPATVVFLLAAVAGARPVAGQTHGWSPFGVGYVANAPSMMAGVNAYVLFPALHGFGLYVDTKWDTDSPRNDPYFLASMTAEQVQEQNPFNDTIIAIPNGQQNSWRSVNVAVIRPVTPALMLYVGGGYARRERFQRFRDSQQQLGQLGIFWAELSTQKETAINVMFGAFLRMGRHIAFQTGFEHRPGGFSLGATLKFPGR
ncbi:MAG: hypothetical protein LJF04_16380 [Gemmatimonadetes bacterium]|nr:hypothetical protein [Gemmatimonadota bacterium]